MAGSRHLPERARALRRAPRWPSLMNATACFWVMAPAPMQRCWHPEGFSLVFGGPVGISTTDGGTLAQPRMRTTYLNVVQDFLSTVRIQTS